MSFDDTTPLSVLLVEDNLGDARLVEHYLGELGHVSSAPPDLTHVTRLEDVPLSDDGTGFSVALLDLGLSGSTGLDTLDRYLATEPPHPVVVLTGFNHTETAITAIRRGAQDYLPKDDLDADRLGRTIRYAIERHQQERELERQNARLDEFAGIVSHDLRNPLNVALGRMQLLNDEYKSEHGPIIERNLERMQVIISDVLTLARQGDDIHEPTPVELTAVVEDAWGCVDTAGATLVLDDSLASVPADPSRLQQLFENLFRNCVEHGVTAPPARDEADGDSELSEADRAKDVSNDVLSEQCLRVHVGVLSDERGFYVEDDGLGIPPEDRERVFDAGFSTNANGTGFGLSIVKRIAEAHNWKASVRSVSGARGVRFEFVFSSPTAGPGVVEDGRV